jgi:CheY-like chemotaxis protein/nitrogen-specific signal transduction histidine kinase
MHQLPDGTPLPCEVTLVRVKYGKDCVVAAYSRDLREYKKMMSDIEQMVEHIRTANEAKSNFLAGMSHEMRTPLNAIVGLTELTLEAEGLDEDVLDNLEKTHNASMMLLNTVNDILDISKIEAEKAKLIPAQYHVASMISDTVTQSAMHIGEKPVRIVLNIPDTLPALLMGDELRVKQIFNNVLSNACKYTKKGTVELGADCWREGDTVWMSAYVRDTGIGIGEENIDKLFDDYIQVDVRNNRKIMGIGLGLHLTKKLLEMMGGTITLESEYGKGSTFTLKIPQGFVNDETIGPDAANNLKNSRYVSEKRRSAKLERIQLPYARVLVVDDVESNLDVAHGLMKPYGLQVDFALSGQQAVRMIRERKVHYSAIFMDHLMPEMDGIEAARIIREEIGTDYAKNIPIIAFTANAVAGNEEMFLAKGFQAFLSKPIHINRLDEIIRQWVHDELQDKWLLFDGLNVAKGIGYLGGNKEIYFDVLRSFTANIPSHLQKIKEVGDPQTYISVVHGIKGSASNICAEEIEEKAGALEKAAKAGDLEFIAAHNGPFLETVRELLSRINEMFSQTDKAEKSKKETPDKKTLLRLLGACILYDVEGAEAAVADLSCYEYESNGALVTWIEEKMAQYNTMDIARELMKMREAGGLQI